MGILSRYIGWQLLLTWLFVLGAVVLVVLFSQSFRFLTLVVENAATLKAFFNLLAISIPGFLPVIVPIAFGIAILFVYQRLITDREMVIMRSQGWSPLRLAAPALGLGVVMVSIMLVLTMLTSPWANRQLVDLQYAVRNNFSVLLVRPGNFTDLVPGLTFYVRQRDASGALAGILIHDFRNPERPVTIMAERGLIQEGGEPKVIVFNGLRQEYNKQQKNLTELRFSNYSFALQLLQKAVPDRARDAREMDGDELLAMAKQQPERATRWHAELHRRISSTLLPLTFAAVALLVLLTGDYSRRNLQKRLAIAASLLVLVQALYLWLSSLINDASWYLLPLYGLIGLPWLLAWLRLGFLGSWQEIFMPRWASQAGTP